MANKPIFVATHPRACSTAFERVFMTQRDTLECAHEPFGDAFYYGPERLGQRYEDDEAGRVDSGFSKTTYQDVMNRLERDASTGKRVFVKDMAYYLMAPDAKPTSLAPSLLKASSKGAQENYSEPGNPTVVPLEALKKWHFAFLIRHPRRGIPSYYRCCIPPLSETTGFKYFAPNEAGYYELRVLFDFLRNQQLVGPRVAQNKRGVGTNGVNGTHEVSGTNGVNGDHKTNGVNGTANGIGHEEVSITVIDADDLLDKPAEVIEAFCKETGLEFDPSMLQWDDNEDQKNYVVDTFAKWNGWHNDAIKSTSLRPRAHRQKVPTTEAEDEEWRQKYGEEGQKIIRATVNENVEHYEYLKSFAIKF